MSNRRGPCRAAPLPTADKPCDWAARGVNLKLVMQNPTPSTSLVPLVLPPARNMAITPLGTVASPCRTPAQARRTVFHSDEHIHPQPTSPIRSAMPFPPARPGKDRGQTRADVFPAWCECL